MKRIPQTRRKGSRLDLRITQDEKNRIVKKAKKYKTSVTEHLVKASKAYDGEWERCSKDWNI